MSNSRILQRASLKHNRLDKSVNSTLSSDNENAQNGTTTSSNNMTIYFIM